MLVIVINIVVALSECASHSTRTSFCVSSVNSESPPPRPFDHHAQQQQRERDSERAGIWLENKGYRVFSTDFPFSLIPYFSPGMLFRVGRDRETQSSQQRNHHLLGMFSRFCHDIAVDLEGIDILLVIRRVWQKCAAYCRDFKCYVTEMYGQYSSWAISVVRRACPCLTSETIECALFFQKKAAVVLRLLPRHTCFSFRSSFNLATLRCSYNLFWVPLVA